MISVKYYWDKFYLKFERFFYSNFKINDPLMAYKIRCHDEMYSEYSLAEILIKHQELIENLQEKYVGLIHDVKRLEEENIGLTNELYEIYNKIDSNEKTVFNLDKFSLGE